MSESFIKACADGNRRIAQLLLSQEKDLDPNYTNSHGCTALHYASANGYVDIMSELLESGAKIDYEDHQGRTALFMAIKARQKPAA
ncbi:ankyrin repeat domain-containing protein [Pseudoalteromonas sp. SR44-5]|nr:ankyrin repeat domain-containing protein [Pseudoalteromonas sp. SR44-5]MBB1368040.1 ankyrin repeat domain-containing protein [Pseudoalteromonas sp. SR44-5]